MPLRVRQLAAALLVALLCALPTAVWALVEDEVGQYEWFLQQLGKPSALAYSADTPDRIYVATGSGVVASVLLKDGTVQWRRVAESNGVVRLLRASSRGLVSVTDSGLVQAWKGASGDLSWQREYGEPVLDLLFAGSGSRQNVVIVRSSEVEARAFSGKAEWALPASAASDSKARFWAATASSDESTLCAVAGGGSTAEVLHIDASNGKVQKKAELPSAAAKALASGSFIIADGQLVVLVGDALSAYPLCSGEGAGEPFDMKKVKSKAPSKFQLLPWQRTRGVFAATNGVATAILGLSAGGRGPRHLRTYDGRAVVGPVFSVHDDEVGQPVAVAAVLDTVTQIQLLDPASGNVQPPISVANYTSADHGHAELLVVQELTGGEHRTVISSVDHSLVGIQGAELVWVREEADRKSVV